MICLIHDIPVYYEEYGTGKPVMGIHGYGLDHRMMTGCMEPIFADKKNYRRIYLDLPGMGKTPSVWMKNSEDMLEVLIGFVNTVIPEENFLLAGDSYGGHLALGLTCKMTDRIDGIALIAPLVTHECYTGDSRPPKQVLYKSNYLEENDDTNAFLEYAVVAVPEFFERYRNEILSGVSIADNDFLHSGRFRGETAGFEKLLKSAKSDKPACIITGRQDHAVGYSFAYELLDRFPRATFAVLDMCGHNLHIENDQLFKQLISDWLCRTEI